MRTPWDQFHKALLAASLEAVGSVAVQVEVPSQVQAIDLVFEPHSDTADIGQRAPHLGALAILIQRSHGPLLLECFSTTPGPVQLDACVRKQLVYHQSLLLAARRRGQPKPTRRPDKPMLWLTSPGRPRSLLDACAATAMDAMPSGFWHTGNHQRLAIVVIDELPTTPDTLILRLMGRRQTLVDAVAEFFRLPRDAPLRPAAEPIVLALLGKIGHDPPEDLMNAVERFRASGEAMLREARRQGERRGERKGQLDATCTVLKQLLTQRFGPLPDDVLTRLKRADLDELTRWTGRVLAAPSLAAVLDDPDMG